MLPIANPFTLVAKHAEYFPMPGKLYYWNRRCSALFNYIPEHAVWDLTNQELNGMESQGRVDDFGNEFTLYSSESAWNVRNYFLVQRSDDPGMFHYRNDSESSHA